jgi:hypothetical protein
MFPIASYVGAGGNIDFTSIPQTFAHLQLRIIGRSGGNTSNSGILIRYNNDAGTNYAFHNTVGSGATATSAGAANQTYGLVGYSTGTNSTAGNFADIIVDIYDYTNTSKNKTSKGLYGFDENGSGFVGITSSAWFNTAAITSFTLINNNFPAGCRADLYGIGTSNATGA